MADAKDYPFESSCHVGDQTGMKNIYQKNIKINTLDTPSYSSLHAIPSTILVKKLEH
jgi:hypothetical protein